MVEDWYSNDELLTQYVSDLGFHQLTKTKLELLEAEAAYYKRKADQGNAGEPSHSNRVAIEDWYSDDELLTQYISD